MVGLARPIVVEGSQHVVESYDHGAGVDVLRVALTERLEMLGVRWIGYMEYPPGTSPSSTPWIPPELREALAQGEIHPDVVSQAASASPCFFTRDGHVALGGRPAAAMIGLALLLLFVASQLFWIGRVVDLGARFIPGKPRRGWLALAAGLLYVFVFAYSFPSIQSCCMGHVFRPADDRLHSTLIEGAFWWWLVGSLPAFALVIAFGTGDRAACTAAWMYRRARKRTQRQVPSDPEGGPPPSPGRRRFLGQTALLLSASPFAAAGYGANREMARYAARGGLGRS